MEYEFYLPKDNKIVIGYQAHFLKEELVWEYGTSSA